MSKMDFLNDLNEIDEKMIEEAAPKKAGSGNGRFLAWALAAAAVILTVGLGVWLHEKNGKVLPETPPSGEKNGQEQELTQDPKEEPNVSEEPIQSSYAEDPDILYEDYWTKIARVTGPVPGAYRADACLAYRTERELLTQCAVLLRAKLTDITNISIEDKSQERVTGHRYVTEACILTLEPVSVLRGELKKEGPVRLFVDKHINSSLEDLNQSLRTADVGKEGLVMLYEIYSGASSYIAKLADYTPGDNMRFAIWSNGSNLLFWEDAFPGFSSSWTLDEAEAYARSVIEDYVTAPEDFAFTLSWKYWGEEAFEDQAYRYDSRDGSYSIIGSYWENEYGAENLTASFKLRPKELDEVYRSLGRLAGLKEKLPSTGRAGDPGTQEIEIWFRANGEEQHVSYSGAYAQNSKDLQLLSAVETELRHHLEKSNSYRAWMDRMEDIASSRRAERSEKISAALLQAFEENGGAPAFYKGMQIVPGGFLEIYLSPCTEIQMRQIRKLLEGYEGGYLFAWGSPENP